MMKVKRKLFNYLFKICFFSVFLFFLLLQPINADEGIQQPTTITGIQPVQLVGGIGKGVREIIKKREKEIIEEKMKDVPPLLEIVVIDSIIPAVFIAGRPAPKETLLVIGMRNKITKELVPLSAGTQIWFEVVNKEGEVKKEIETGFSKENPYRVEAPVSSVSFKGEEIIKFVGGMDPEDFLKKFYLKICVSIK